MNLSMPKSELKEFISRQLSNFFPDKYKFEGNDVDMAIDMAIQRTEYCFKHIKLPHYNRENQVWFDHLHSDQYSSFLYFLSNTLWKESENKPICDKLILLNKSLNALFISYKCNMPNIFYLSHPLGTVLGNACYSDFLAVMHNVTVNTVYDGNIQPKIGKGVFLSTGVSIIGSNSIGDFSSIGANTLLYKVDVPNDSIAFTDSNGELQIRKNKKEIYVQSIFNTKIK